MRSIYNAIHFSCSSVKALYIRHSDSVSIMNSNFIKNEAISGGGAIALHYVFPVHTVDSSSISDETEFFSKHGVRLYNTDFFDSRALFGAGIFIFDCKSTDVL